jgi:hypothetical protein
MSFADLKAAGVINEDEKTTPGCNQYQLLSAGKIDGGVGFSKERGVEAIGPDQKVSTPEGVTIGSTLAKAKAVYPTIDEPAAKQYGRTYPTVPGNAKAVYRLGIHNGAVDRINLQYSDQGCYE